MTTAEPIIVEEKEVVVDENESPAATSVVPATSRLPRASSAERKK